MKFTLDICTYRQFKKKKQTKPENFWSTKVCLPDNHDRKQVISQNEYQILCILLITCF